MERFTEEVLFVSPLPRPERKRRTRRNFTTSTNFADEDDEKDDESEKQPDGILFQSLFSWTMMNMNTNDLETFPRAIARLSQRDGVKQTSSSSKKDDENEKKRKRRLMLEEFSVGFTRGRWRDAGAFGRKPMNFETSSALGMRSLRSSLRTVSHSPTSCSESTSPTKLVSSSRIVAAQISKGCTCSTASGECYPSPFLRGTRPPRRNFPQPPPLCTRTASPFLPRPPAQVRTNAERSKSNQCRTQHMSADPKPMQNGTKQCRTEQSYAGGRRASA